MWCVIESLENNSKMVIAVPKTWVFNEEVLLWPPKHVSTSSARKNCLKPGLNWSEYNCRVLVDNISE